MAIDVNIASGRIDKGDTKKLTVTPKDEDGETMTATLEIVLTSPSGEDTTYTQSPANHTFDEAGIWRITVTATDSEGNAEVETGGVQVY